MRCLMTVFAMSAAAFAMPPAMAQDQNDQTEQQASPVTSVAAGLSQGRSESADIFTDAQRQAAQDLAEQGLADRLGYEVVESLTTEVGQRLAGTDAEARARDWAVAKLTELGFSNVRVEPFEVALWTRGHEHAEIVSPFPQELEVTALGGSVSTDGEAVVGEIVRFDTLADLEEAPENSLEGKIAFVDEFMTRTQDGSGYGVAVRKRSGAAIEAGKRGALAALIRSVGTDHRRFPHTGQMRYDPDAPAVPIAALSAPDADQLARALERGAVTVSLELETRSPGLVPSGNVIGEIPGETDEIVVLGAHLDSWDLGTGAVDDGAGIGIVTAAAKLIDALPGQPKRTIRVVYFGSEEVGLVGAKAYAEQHADELAKHHVAAESDFGARKIWRFETRFGEDQLDKAEAIARMLLPLGVGPGDNEASGGPDLGYLRQAGVPVVTLRQNGWDYFDLHHTADDTLDKIDPEELAQNVAVYAVFAYLASEVEGGFRSGINTNGAVASE